MRPKRLPENVIESHISHLYRTVISKPGKEVGGTNQQLGDLPAEQALARDYMHPLVTGRSSALLVLTVSASHYTFFVAFFRNRRLRRSIHPGDTFPAS